MAAAAGYVRKSVDDGGHLRAPVRSIPEVGNIDIWTEGADIVDTGVPDLFFLLRHFLFLLLLLLTASRALLKRQALMEILIKRRLPKAFCKILNKRIEQKRGDREAFAV